jgi:hypothetical protein
VRDSDELRLESVATRASCASPRSVSKVHQDDYLEGHRQKPEGDRSFSA